MKVDCLVIGSGAGGAVTALRLAEAGREVVILEEGRDHPASDYGRSPPEAMQLLYRRGGMTPILGRSPIGFVEGCCVGGSTEINSGFWHRTPASALADWQRETALAEASAAELEPHFAWAEEQLGVGRYDGPMPPSTQLFLDGIAALKWTGAEVPRIAPGCKSSNACASGCPTGAKAGASRSLLPRARALGAQILTRSRAVRLVQDGGRITGVIARVQADGGAERDMHIEAEHVFVCAGAMQTPLLLRRSGFRQNVGDSLKLHPMIKVIAHFQKRRKRRRVGAATGAGQRVLAAHFARRRVFHAGPRRGHSQ